MLTLYIVRLNAQCHVISAKWVVYVSSFVCLSVCLPVSKMSRKVLGEFFCENFGRDRPWGRNN